MKKSFVFTLIAFLACFNAFSQSLPYIKSSSFETGETLVYKLKYGFITAAEATLQVLDSDIKYNGKPTYHLLAQGKTNGTFDIFFKVRNKYESFIDKTTYTPYFYAEDIKEDNYTRTDKVRFYQSEKKIVGSKGTYTSPVAQTFDLVSAYYFARNLDLSSVRIGDKLTLRYFLKDEVTPLTIEYMGKEVVKTSQGRVNCLKFSPSISPGRIFKKNSRLYLWITDDENRIPVKAQGDVIVGSITMELASVSGLKEPLKIIK
ncbi:hypothetical protein Pedsa_3220 [Pseudopedobacter saltans DSM 12145]|uniref:DUF3108 domain-containing protein n=1 Tax=Pseudopedobacter saltans (strain ATCC 51119 / DSM 12145 / JCM 21818 / CCUG 39354 / LMG 10337 / NBRC 100064 / NCIMB 13643) TaxID=762903 RepID=F0SBC9_PSESL|nr:DUF3108 domain-containing protein [Pseudopedobacter saltans]ADY53756.1 hypothetical protein Pedsa_3220 [Pseudopedobacter saltans DSM 12145]